MTTPTWRADIGSAPKRPHLVLLVLPFIWQVGCIPLVNDVALRPFGMPFPMVWQMAGVVFASLIFALVFHLDRRAGLEEEEAEFISVTAPAATPTPQVAP